MLLEQFSGCGLETWWFVVKKSLGSSETAGES